MNQRIGVNKSQMDYKWINIVRADGGDRYEMLCWNTHSIPCAVWRAVSMRASSSNFVSRTWRCLYSEDPSHHCVTMANWGLLTHPINSKILTCLFKETTWITMIDKMVELYYLVFLKTATSFLKACNWAGVGSLTLRVLTATGPCQWPR